MSIFNMALRIFVCTVLFSTVMVEVLGQSNGNYTDQAKVLILGAGVAGIQAGKVMQDLGLTDFLIIEAADKIGGRIKSGTFGGYTVQFGAQWLVTRVSYDPIYQWCVDNSIAFKKSHFLDIAILGHTGTDIRGEAEQVATNLDTIAEKVVAFATNMGKGQACNCSDASLRDVFRKAGWNPTTPLDYAMEYFYVDFDSAQPEKLSGKTWGFDSSDRQSDTQYYVTNQDGGFQKFITSYAATYITPGDSRLKLNSKVVKITYNDNGVVAETQDGRRYFGEQVLVTFSLGVLQKLGGTMFEPKLPEWKLDSINQFDMATYMAIYVRFDSSANAFWNSNEWTLFANERRGYFPLLHNMEKHYSGSRIIQLIVTNAEAWRLEAMTDEEIKSEIFNFLRKVYGNSVPNITEIYVPRWSTDPLFYGSYSLWPVGYTKTSHNSLGASVGRVHFAGEAYDQTWLGYVYGAYITGDKKGRAITVCVKDSTKCEVFVPQELCKVKKNDINEFRDDGTCFNTASVHLAGNWKVLFFVLMLFSTNIR